MTSDSILYFITQQKTANNFTNCTLSSIRPASPKNAVPKRSQWVAFILSKKEKIPRTHFPSSTYIASAIYPRYVHQGLRRVENFHPLYICILGGGVKHFLVHASINVLSQRKTTTRVYLDILSPMPLHFRPNIRNVNRSLVFSFSPHNTRLPSNGRLFKSRVTRGSNFASQVSYTSLATERAVHSSKMSARLPELLESLLSPLAIARVCGAVVACCTRRLELNFEWVMACFCFLAAGVPSLRERSCRRDADFNIFSLRNYSTPTIYG